MRLRTFIAALSLGGATLVASLAARAEYRKPQPGIAGLSWMAGSWAGDHDGGTIEEHWMLPKGKSMVGMSRLVINEKSAFWECLRIVERDDGTVVYLAQPLGKAPAVEFKMTFSEVGAVTFENPSHDNPKIIRYVQSDEGKTLTATTEGDEKSKHEVHEVIMQKSALAP